MTTQGRLPQTQPAGEHGSSEKAEASSYELVARSQWLIANCQLLFASCALRPLCGFDQRRKPRGVVNRDIGQHLAIQLHSRLLQAADELVVAEPLRAGGGADAHDPDGAKLALLLLAASVGKLQSALDGLFCRTIQLGFCEEIPASPLQYLFAALATLGTTFNAGHECSFFSVPDSRRFTRLEAELVVSLFTR